MSELKSLDVSELKSLGVYGKPSAEVCAIVCSDILRTGFLCFFFHLFDAIRNTSDEVILQMAGCAQARYSLKTRLSPIDREEWDDTLKRRKDTAESLLEILKTYIASTQSVLNTLLSKQEFVSVAVYADYERILELLSDATVDTYLRRVQNDIKGLYEGFKTLTTSLNIPQPVWE
jgi:hypothetical protein